MNAAQAAGVNRVTLYRWIKADPSFRAAYNAWEQAACESARARIVMAADSAVTNVVESVRIDDSKVLIIEMQHATWFAGMLHSQLCLVPA